MSRQLAVSYGSGARPVYGGEGQRALAPAGARPVASTEEYISPEEAEADNNQCRGTAKHGGRCGARPANGTQLCAGHLRSEAARAAATDE